jgi:threonine synthase
VRAFEQGRLQAEAFPNARTVASGLRVPAAIGDFLMLQALRASEGTAIAVSDEDLLAGTVEMSQALGNFVCPEAGAVWAAARRLADQGWIRPAEKIVLFNTGTGLKYGHLFPPGSLPVLDPTKTEGFEHWAAEVVECRSSKT